MYMCVNNIQFKCNSRHERVVNKERASMSTYTNAKTKMGLGASSLRCGLHSSLVMPNACHPFTRACLLGPGMRMQEQISQTCREGRSSAASAELERPAFCLVVPGIRQARLRCTTHATELINCFTSTCPVFKLANSARQKSAAAHASSLTCTKSRNQRRVANLCTNLQGYQRHPEEARLSMCPAPSLVRQKLCTDTSHQTAP